MNTPLLTRAAAYLDRLPPAISGSGGHSATFRAATVLVQGFAFSEADAWPLLTAWNHTHCHPPWTDRDLRHKLRSALRSSASSASARPAGYLLKGDETMFATWRTIPSAPPLSEADRKARMRASWHAFKPLKPALIDRIAELRHILPDAVALAQRHGFLSGAMIDGEPSYLLHEGPFAQARRLDGLPFRRADGSEIKSKNLPGSEGAFIGQRLLNLHGHAVENVLVVEGAIGLIEALAAFLLAETTQPWVILAATSASSRFSRDPALLAQLQGRHLRLLPDADDTGLNAAAVWLAELESAGIQAEAMPMPPGCKDLGPVIADPAPHQAFLNSLFAEARITSSPSLSINSQPQTINTHIHTKMNDITHLLEKLIEAQNAARSRPHTLAPAVGATAPEAPVLDLSSCLVSATALQSIILPVRLRLLDRWLCAADLGFIYAPRGVGKTWLAMALPVALSQKRPLGEWQAGDQAVRVLYVDGEMPLELTQQRTRFLGLDEGVQYLHHETLFDTLGYSLNIGLAEHREAITSLVLDQGFQCLILDNLSALASGVDENKGSDYEPIGQWLLDLRRLKITVIVIHHAGRNGFMRGHSKREDACSWILELRDAKTEGEPGAKFISHFAKPSRNTGQPMPDLLWHFTTTPDGKSNIECELAVASEYEQFIQHVKEGVESQIDIAEMMGKHRGTVSKWVVKALNENRIRGRGNKLLPPLAAAQPVDLDSSDEDGRTGDAGVR